MSGLNRPGAARRGFEQRPASTAELAAGPELTVGASACLPTTLPAIQVLTRNARRHATAASGGALVTGPFRDAWPGSSPRRRAGVAAARNRTSQAALEHEDVKSPGRIRVVSCE